MTGHARGRQRRSAGRAVPPRTPVRPACPRVRRPGQDWAPCGTGNAPPGTRVPGGPCCRSGRRGRTPRSRSGARSASRSPPSPGSTPRSTCWTVRCSRSTRCSSRSPSGCCRRSPVRDAAAPGTVLRAVPAAAALITLGTYLAAATWSAALGMLLVGFVLVVGASLGPRAAGVVPALQLCYILACFPPYAPGTLPDRLAGLAVGATATVLCERLLLPEPEQPSYRSRVADGLELAARAVRGLLRAAPTAGRRPSGCGRRAGSCACHGRRPASGPPERGRGTVRWPRPGMRPAGSSTCSPSSRRCCARRSTCPRPHCCAGSPPPAPTRPPPCAARALRPASSGSRR